MVATIEPHRCNERCVCPEHEKTQLLWSAAEKIHACPLRECRYAHGLEPEIWRESEDMRNARLYAAYVKIPLIYKRNPAPSSTWCSRC